MSYYSFNRRGLLQKAKEKYGNSGKEKVIIETINMS